MRSLALPFLLGLGLWSAASGLSSRRELWDDPAFWTRAWPAALILSALLGRLLPGAGWKPGAAVGAALLPVILAGASDWSLLPMGAALVAVLALPHAAASALAGRTSGR
ncbi:MAG: hypothetical protein K2X91_11900 [Thermoleophilia bacterium]|nr:hypothetical protein [Thermoleophilia bacterium]